MEADIAKVDTEIGHHGYSHKRPEPQDLAQDKEEIDRGLDALERVLGVGLSASRALRRDSDGLLKQA